MFLCSACATGKVGVIDTADAVCDALKEPIDGVLDAVVGKGSQIITAGAGDVILRSDDLAVAYDSSCE